jgi:cytochrome oxidase Cu insertion factor (SCO1/SenC/PrrC family)
MLVAAAVCVAACVAQAAPDPGRPAAPRMEFVPPAPGTYELQRIQRAPDGLLLDARAQPRRLSAYTTNKITLLTFFYTYCVDPWGCPFSYATLTGLRDRVMSEPTLSGRVRFVSVSFDPTHDTPDALRRYGARFMDDQRFEWQFLTARSVADLLPVLDSFGQDVRVEKDAAGKPTRTMNHMLKMFLIDHDGMVREIYTLAYIHPAVMFNDIRTLALEDGAVAAR